MKSGLEWERRESSKRPKPAAIHRAQARRQSRLIKLGEYKIPSGE
jgi:hypothetical protein